MKQVQVKVYFKGKGYPFVVSAVIKNGKPSLSDDTLDEILDSVGVGPDDSYQLSF